MNYSSRIKGQSVGGSRSGNRDGGIIMDLRVGERKLSPGFTATKLLVILYNMVRHASTLFCSKVLAYC